VNRAILKHLKAQCSTHHHHVVASRHPPGLVVGDETHLMGYGAIIRADTPPLRGNCVYRNLDRPRASRRKKPMYRLCARGSRGRLGDIPNRIPAGFGGRGGWKEDVRTAIRSPNFSAVKIRGRLGTWIVSVPTRTSGFRERIADHRRRTFAAAEHFWPAKLAPRHIF